MNRSGRQDPKQDELALSSVAAHQLFPGRTSLYPSEVSKALAITERQVLDLIEEGELVAINIASGKLTSDNPKGSKSGRRYLRIPVSSYDQFVKARKSA